MASVPEPTLPKPTMPTFTSRIRALWHGRTGLPACPILLGFERSHINGEAILHIGLEQSLIGLVDLLDRDDFDIRGDVMCAAKVQHLLGLGDAADGRTGEAAASHNKAEARDGKGLFRCADEGEVAVAAEQLNVSVDVVLG